MPLVKSVLVRLGVTGEDKVKTKLDELRAKADALGHMDPKIKIDLEIARAELNLKILREEITAEDAAKMKLQLDTSEGVAKLAALQAMKDHLDDPIDIKIKTDKRFNFAGAGGGFFGTITKGLESILNLGPAAIPVLAGIAGIILVMIQYIGALITELAAAGIGIAAFGVLAIPTFMKIFAGIQAVSGAADKVAKAAAWKAIPAAIRPAVQAGLDLKGTFDKLVLAMRPQAVRIFGDALKIVSDALPLLLPIAHSVGKAIDGLLRGFDGFVKSAGFKAFMSQMDALAGPAVKAIGVGLGEVATALGDLIQAGTNPEGLQMLAATFKILAGTIRGIANAIRIGQNAFYAFMGFITGPFASVVIGTAKRVADAFLTMISTVARIGSHVPGFGWLKGIADSADRAKIRVDNSLEGMLAKAKAVNASINSLQTVFKLQGNITDLQNKIAAAKASLRTVPKSQQTRIRADISQAQQQIAAIRVALMALNGLTATTYVNTISIGGGNRIRGYASGGPVTAAATGGLRSGLIKVGELGPELISVPVGSYVHTASESRTMTAAAGGGGDFIINNLYVTTPDGPSLVRSLQDYAKRNGPIKLRVRS
jgi:hypothetical protein